MTESGARSSSEEPGRDKLILKQVRKRLDESGEWVFYRDRPEWSDVTPIPQDDGANPVVRIAYSDRFKDVYDYFRAVLKSGEKSERVLQLTVDALDQNPANYTVWYYRREVLKALKSDLKKEMKYCREMIEEHPKNYQVWQHRRALIEWAQDPSTELRQWVLQTFKLWDKELDYVQDLIAVDIRNNSAWNQRFFVISQSSGWTKEVVRSEVNYAMDKIKKVVKNESSWNYLRGVLNQCENEELKSELKSEIRSWCESKYESGETSPYMLGYIVDSLQQDLDEANSSGDNGSNQAIIDKLEKLCNLLANNCDKIRHNYWKFILQSAKKKHSIGG